ncbi:DoxX family membrane protein [Corynebacterium qintianiae]|uniref:DoxX family membrane protein n=1 Tax=Corynebacterium qintianiae TaxID=2709392 RepID=A0A7T0KQE0_9CORY|nr:DoxX family protein [Corynebacterium qintianiae]QPK84123.1 DoxX family membrane protein [Corynebacterium qintianiae]
MIRKLARPMLASVYVIDGVETVVNPSAHRESAESVLKKLRSVVPAPYRAYLPSSPETAAQVVGGVKAGAGSLFALGKAPRTAATLLAATAIPSVIGRHAFWEATNEEEKTRRRNGAVTDVALLGGILLASVDTAGNPGLQWRAKNAARVAKKNVQQALPTQSESEKALNKAGNWISDTADQVTSYVGENKDDWAKSATALAKDAKKQTSNFISTAGDWIEDATDQAQDAYNDAKPNKVQRFVAKRKAKSSANDIVDNLQSTLEGLSPSALDKAKAKRKATKLQNRAQDAVSSLQGAFDDLDLAPSKRQQRKAKKNVKQLQKRAEKAVKQAQKKLS